MTTNKGSTPSKREPQVFEVPDDGRTREQLIAEIAVNGDLANAATLMTYSHANLGDGCINQAVKSLQKSIKASKQGDTSVSDTLLIGQATVLNAIFNELTRRAALNMGQHLDAAEAYMRLALKAQSQCRATLESLSRIKNPPNVAFVRQANFANGPQQVNNGPQPGRNEAVGRVEKTETPPIELLEANNGEWVDARTTVAAGRGDQTLEAVGEVKRTANRCRQS